MRIVRDPINMGSCVLVLGMFDGVHRGHQALLMAGRDLADQYGMPLHVCTFEPHPLQVLRKEAAPPLLTTLTERAQLMASFGVDALCVHTFTRKVASQEPEDFLRQLDEVYNPHAIVAGFNYSFGSKGRGDGEMLKAWGAEHGCEVVIVPKVELDGDSVSSTRIRLMLREGNIHGATRLLGHGYTLSGRVTSGKRIGRTMGYPTANVEIPQGKALPAYGVYACWLTVGSETHEAVVNVGRHPTLPEGAVTVEAHVLDDSLDLYGKKVRLTLLHFQRPEKTFADVEELRQQITQDAEDARAWFATLT